MTSCIRVAREDLGFQGHQAQEDFLDLQDPKVQMDIQENQDLEDLLDFQEVQGWKEHLGLKACLVIRVVKGSQVYQVIINQV